MKKNLRLVSFFAACFFFALEIPAQELFPAELMLRAYSHCYPGKSGGVIFQNGDWTIRAGNETYYWAGGRMLPASLKDRTDLYSPFTFEIYPDTIPSPEIYSPQYTEALRAHGKMESMRGEDDLHRGFQAAIFGGINRREIESQLRQIDFLGKRISAHRDITQALERIDTAIRAEAAVEAAESGGKIAAFISSIGQMGGYNWREIRGSNRMSYHSWGLAVDIQPKDAEDKAVFWLWESARNENWMLIPLSDRWMPPAAVIEAFEREGFVWGGKWALYDTMHFEYRPELHELKRLLASQEESFSALPSRAASRDLHHLYPDSLGYFRDLGSRE